MSKPLIVLVGAGGHCKSCLDVIEQDGRFQVAGIVDRVAEGAPREVLGYPILGDDDRLGEIRRSVGCALVAVGQLRSAETRVRIYAHLCELGYQLPAIVSPRAYVSRHALIGAGTIVMHGATVNAAARVGENCILNSHCLVEHDAVLEPHCHLSTGAIVNGQAVVGAGSFVGSGAVVVQGEKVPPGSFVKAGRLFYGGQCK